MGESRQREPSSFKLSVQCGANSTELKKEGEEQRTTEGHNHGLVVTVEETEKDRGRGEYH